MRNILISLGSTWHEVHGSTWHEAHGSQHDMYGTCLLHTSIMAKKLIIVYDIFFGKRNFRTFAAQLKQWNTYYKKTRHKQTWPCASNCPARAWIVKQHVYVHECMHAWKRDCIWSQLCLKNRHPKKNGKKKKPEQGGWGEWHLKCWHQLQWPEWPSWKCPVGMKGVL